MLKVVSNTTPIISLLKLNKLHILRDVYKEIFIPAAVYQEIENGKDKEFYCDLSTVEWVNIASITNKQATKYFLDLDQGEAEAIVLASELNADLIILDEKIGRFHAKNAELNLTGTIGVLIKAKKLGLIHEIGPLLHELTSKNVWIDPKLITKILIQAGEN